MTELLEEPQALEPVDDWSDVDPDYEPILPDDDEQDDIVEDPSELDEDLTEEEIEIPGDLAELLPFWVSYELHGRNLDAETTWALLATEDFDGDLEVEVDGLTAGARWEFRVRLIDRDGRHSRFSEPLVIDLPTDFTPPPAPTEPIVRNVRGYTAVGWDGLLQGPTPGDMSHVQLYVQQQHPDGDPDGEAGDPRRITTMSTAGEHPLLQFLANVLHKAWFTAVDTTGNESPWSPQVEFTPEPPVNEDAINERLDEARQEREAYVEDFDQRTAGYDAAIGELDTRVGPALESSISEAVTEAQSNLQGLDQRQGAAEQGISEATDRLGTAETLLAGRERVFTGEGEPDETTAARGITYEWAGEAHASESVKRVDGVEVARNLATNSSFEEHATRDWVFGSRVNSHGRTALVSRVTAGIYSTILSFEPGATQIQTLARTETSAQPGQWVAVSMWATTTNRDMFADLVISEFTESGSFLAHNYRGDYQQLGRNEMVQFTFAYQVTNPGTARAWGGIVFSNTQGYFTSPDGFAYLDAVHLAVAGTEAEALAQVASYFDGDTEDAVDAPATEGTIYLQTEGGDTKKIWRRGAEGWEEMPLLDEVFRSIGVGKLAADGASINEAVVEQLLADKASIIAGEMQKLAVTERADFVSAWADELFADEFTARSSTVARQIVAARNLYNDPLFERIDQYLGWGTADPEWDAVDGGIEANGTGVLTGSYADTMAMLIPARPGEQFEVSVDFSFAEGSIGEGVIYTRAADADGNYLSGTAQSPLRATEAGRHTASWTAAEGAAYVYIGFYVAASTPTSTRIRFENIRVESLLEGRIIIEGLLQATEGELQRLLTDETISRIVWAEIVRAGLLEADEGLIGGVLLKDGAVTLDKLNAIEEIAAALVRTVELEAGTFKTNDMTSMRILSSIIESTIYLIHNAAGDVSVRLDGVDNYIAGRIHAGMANNAGITIDYGTKQVATGWTDEGDPVEVIEENVTPYIEFTDPRFNYLRKPALWLGAEGGLNIIPGREVGTSSGDGELRVWGRMHPNRVVTSRVEIPTSSGVQPGGMRRDGPRTRLHGRTPDVAGSLDMISARQHGPFQITNYYRSTVYWSAPPETGLRRPVVSASISQGGLNATHHGTAVSSGHLVGSFRYMLTPSSNHGFNMWIDYIATWQ